MNSIEQLITDLKAAKARGVTYSSIAQYAGVKSTTISQLLRGKIRSVRLDTYQCLRSALDVLCP